MDAEKVVCYDRGACGNNDALLATLASNGGMNGAWNNPFAYLIWMCMMRGWNGNGENGTDFNSRQIAALQDSVNTIHNNGDSEEKIFGDAYLFYFKDEDFEGNTKPFKYYKSMI